MYRRLGKLANNWSGFSWRGWNWWGHETVCIFVAISNMNCRLHDLANIHFLTVLLIAFVAMIPVVDPWMQQCWCAQIWVLICFFNGWTARSTKLWGYTTSARSPDWHPRQKNLKFNFFDKLFLAIFLSLLYMATKSWSFFRCFFQVKEFQEMFL